MSDGSPGQVFTLAHPPVLSRGSDEVVQVVEDDGVHTWEAVEDFARSGPEDRHCQWEDASGEIRFGPAIRDRDGTVRQYGAIPPAQARVVVTAYRSGGGHEGNLGEHALTVLQTTVPYIDRVDNRVPARGGSDAETVEQAKGRGPMELQHGERAVSAEDFEWFATRATKAVARAHALGPDESGAGVRLLVVPTLQHRRHDALALADVSPLPADIVEAVAQELEPRRSLGTTIVVRAPEYVGISVAAQIEPVGGAVAEAVVRAALEALYRYVHPLLGGPSVKGWPFGHDVAAADIVRRLSAVPGVHHVADLALFQADLVRGRRLDRAREAVAIGRLQLPLSFRHSVVVA